MRGIAWARIVVLGACIAAAGGASAAVTVAEKTRGYEISGRTGAALLAAMDRHGPTQGFLTRAIAQTRYSVSWTIEWGETRTGCRVTSIDGKLDIIYTYPAARDLPPALQRRWARFLAGVKKHEKTHGDMARQMARTVEKSVAKVSVEADRGCRKARAEAKRRMTAIYADYEARQIKFDTREHREGGAVEGLIDRLVKN